MDTVQRLKAFSFEALTAVAAKKFPRARLEVIADVQDKRLTLHNIVTWSSNVKREQVLDACFFRIPDDVTWIGFSPVQYIGYHDFLQGDMFSVQVGFSREQS